VADQHPHANKNVEETPEFYVPELGPDVKVYIEANDKQGIHHLGRYQWATALCAKRRRILDIACGAGFGAKMYADACPDAEVVGVDYDPRAVAHAERSYNAPRLSYRHGNVVTWQYADSTPLGRFDFISSFDTIEHLLHRELALINLAENLADDGMLVLSTPCGKPTSVLNPGWEHHKIEYGYHDLLNLLKRFFRTVLIPDDRTLPNQIFWDDVVNRGKMRYLNRVNPVACLAPIKFRK
jgi:SAM-dependent methyltransferase